MLLCNIQKSGRSALLYLPRRRKISTSMTSSSASRELYTDPKYDKKKIKTELNPHICVE